MAIKVFWTDFAKKQLKDIFEFYKIKANKEIAEKLVSGIVIKTKTIEFQKDIGQIEEFLLRKEKFRYLVYKNYKIIGLMHKKIGLKSVIFLTCVKILST